jgi:hypothetical protein
MIVDALQRLGPCLSTKLAEYLIKTYGLTPAAARQRISRAPAEVKRLGHLPFQRKARFLYLQKDYATPWYWDKLFSAIYATQNAYARALCAVLAREMVPVKQFVISCGAPVAQKKHIWADTVLKRLVAANVLVIETLPGLGECVMTKRTHEITDPKYGILVAQARSKLIAEGILLNSIKEWLRRLAFASYNSVKIRTGTGKPSQVGPFAWDLTAPSYITGLTSWQKDAVKPGFVICDVLLNQDVHSQHIEPFLYKVKSLQALKNIGRTMFIFVAQSYKSEAFHALREAGIIPATPESLFGKDIAEAFQELIGSLTKAARGVLDPNKFDELFNRLSKLEGAAGNMRGALFEFLVAEIVRKTSPTEVHLNKICPGKTGTAEVDVWELKEGIIARMIECKGMTPGNMVDDQEIELWLTKRITRVREYLNSQGWKAPKPCFELWTSGVISSDSWERIDKTRKANAAKFDLNIVGPTKLIEKAEAVGDPSLLNLLKNHFVPMDGDGVIFP